MPTKAAPRFFDVAESHDVDIETSFYVVDKASLLRLPDGAAMSKGILDAARCFVLPKAKSMKVADVASTWLVQQRPLAVTLPKLVSFIDERDQCLAFYWRTTDRDGEPWLVCLRPPFDVDKLPSDGALQAVKLSQIKSFSPIVNESGGSLLTFTNKFIKEGSATFKHQKLNSVATINSFSAKDNPQMFVGSKLAAFTELELRVRRSQQTTRVGEKQPRAKAAQEDQQAELAKMHEELKFVSALKKDLDALLPILELPLDKRFLMMGSKDTCEADITALCAF